VAIPIGVGRQSVIDLTITVVVDAVAGFRIARIAAGIAVIAIVIGRIAGSGRVMTVTVCIGGQPFVDLSITIVVFSVTDLGSTRINGIVVVVAVNIVAVIVIVSVSKRMGNKERTEPDSI
jgi:hypothetical protein